MLILMKELTKIKRDDMGLSEVRRLGKEEEMLKSGDAYYRKVGLRAAKRNMEWTL